MLARRELRGRVSSGRRTWIEPLARDLEWVRRERRRVEEPQVTRGQARGRIVGEAAEDLLHFVDGQAGGHVEHDLRAHRLRARFVTGLGHATRPHLPEREAERVDVVFGGRAAGANAFGRHVVRRSAVGWRAGATRRDARTLFRETEIEDDRFAEPAVGSRRDHDVARLQIAVHETLRVNRCDARADLAREPAELVRRVPALRFLPADVRVERLTRDVFHHEDRPVFRRRQVVHAAHVRVAHATRVEELLAEGFVVAGHARLFANDLQRDGELRRSVVREEHLSHAPLPEALSNLVAIVDHRSGDDR